MASQLKRLQRLFLHCWAILRFVLKFQMGILHVHIYSFLIIVKQLKICITAKTTHFSCNEFYAEQRKGYLKFFWFTLYIMQVSKCFKKINSNSLLPVRWSLKNERSYRCGLVLQVCYLGRVHMLHFVSVAKKQWGWKDWTFLISKY